VVEGVSFELARGDYLCVVGENGSGKTTLMKGILGLLPLSGGDIEFHGLKSTEIGYLPQQTVVQRDFPASVREVVLSGRLNRHGFFPFYTRRDRACVDESLERLGMVSEAGRSYRDLSTGQQQRVLLARALCAADKFLMLDEPASGLDPVVAFEMYALLEKLNRDGMTIIVVSHDLQSAVLYGGKILHMGGKALFCGPTDDYVKTGLYYHMSGRCCPEESDIALT
jgi:zinc transport system ATP-binding protein